MASPEAVSLISAFEVFKGNWQGLQVDSWQAILHSPYSLRYLQENISAFIFEFSNCCSAEIDAWHDMVRLVFFQWKMLILCGAGWTS